jgi:putative membrane protein
VWLPWRRGIGNGRVLQLVEVSGAAVWRLEPLQAAPLALAALLYARRAATLAGRGRPVPAARRLWFAAGLALLAVAIATPIDTIGEERLFWVHMLQHLLIGDLAAFCVVKGLTGPLLRPLLAFAPVRRLRVLAHPLVALPLWAAGLYAWHLPALYDAALAHGALHALEHATFFTAGALMWAAVIEPLPGVRWFNAGWKAAYVLAVRAAGTALAMVFIWSGRPLYDWYGTGLPDQRLGGLVMFTEGGIVTLLAFTWLFLAWMDDRSPTRALRAPPPPPPPDRAGSRRSSGAPGRLA